MAKVYVVTIGSYSDYEIAGVFSTKERAEAYHALLTWKYHPHEEVNKIEEWGLDEGYPNAKAIQVSMWSDGELLYTSHDIVSLPLTVPQYQIGVRGRLINIVLTDDEQRAIKATNELRARLIAMNEWPAAEVTQT